MATQLDSRQIKKRIALLKLGAAAGATLESILDKINVEFDAPLRIAASAIPDAVLNFSSSLLAAADGANKVVSPVKKQIFSALTNPTINFQTQAVSNAADFDVTWGTATLGQFRYAAFTLIGSGKIKVLFSGEFASEAALAAAVNPGSLFVSGGSPIGYVTLQATNASPAAYKTAGSATDIIENAKIYRPAASGGGSASGTGSGSGGGELVDLLYQAAIRDSFADIPDGTTTVDISAGFTDATLHDVANELFRLAYDASKTVSATGTAVTMSSAPTFTVKAGDIINIPGVDSPKKITAVTTQTTYTVESAWTVDPAAAACVVSQAVHTVDLNAFTNGGLGLAASSQFTGNIDDVLVAYADSDASSDVIPDFGSVADMGFSVSADGTDWSEAKIRPDSLSDLLTAASTPTASTQFKIRFFANKTSGSGFVNLLAYKAFFHKQTGETVGAQLFSAFARPTSSIYQNVTHGVSGGKSRFQFTFAYPRGANEGQASGAILQVYANGQRVPRFVSGVTDPTQAYFVEISDTIIEMDTDYSSAGIDFQFRVESTIIDSNTNNTVRLSEAESILNQSVDAQVVASFLTAVNGSPTGSQFRSDITGRASIPDLSANLNTSIGINRIATQSISQLQDEFGPSGQPVFKTVNDKFNQIRFVGSQWKATPNAQGNQLYTTGNTTDYIEIVFYGTGLNILSILYAATQDWRVSVDGGSEGANIVSASYSAILATRNYATNQIVPVVTGLSLGVHTVKIRNNNAASSSFDCYGFEILNQSTSISVAPGTAIKGKYSNSLAVLATPAFSSGFESGTLGTRGGNAVVYLKPDGTIGKAVTPTNSSQANFTSADHTNEDLIRSYNPREFGANRADDISTMVGTNVTRAFTLDDGTTTLTVTNTSLQVFGGIDALVCGASGTITLTFIGTGLDIQVSVDSATRSFSSVSIDGAASIGAISKTLSTPIETRKIVSGLPYGTHTVKFVADAGTGSFGVSSFIIYQPKKPTIPADSIEIAQYNILADFAANATAGLETIATGILRKASLREYTYVGAGWVVDTIDPAAYINGFTTRTNGSTQYFEYTFFGTGFEMRGRANTTFSATNTVALQNLNGGSLLTLTTANFPSITASSYGGFSFNSATGNLSEAVSNTIGSGFRVSGLPLGEYKIRVTNGTANFMDVEAIDVITPIYSPSSNIPAVFQNTLSVGSDSIADLRKWNDRDILDEKISTVVLAQAVTSSPSTTSTTSIPCPDMSATVYSKGSRFKISFTSTVRNTVAGNSCRFVLVIDGITLTETEILIQPGSANFDQGAVINHNMYLSKGFHKVDVFWRTSAGTMSSSSNLRALLVEEMN